MDETYIRAAGTWRYPSRAVGKDRRTREYYISIRRTTTPATRFLGKALRSTGRGGPEGGPREICTDKAPTYAAAIATLIKSRTLWKEVEDRQVKYLNNVIEGDQGRLKSVSGPTGGGVKNSLSAYRTLQGVEAIHALRKGKGEGVRPRTVGTGCGDRGERLRQRLTCPTDHQTPGIELPAGAHDPSL